MYSSLKSIDIDLLSIKYSISSSIFFYVGSYYGIVYVIDQNTGTHLLSFKPHVQVDSLLVLPDGSLATTSQDNTIKIWE